MIGEKYDNEKRNKFIITTTNYEGLELPVDNTDIDYITSVLSIKYKDNFDLPPYHFIVSKDSYKQIKGTTLKHQDNDISILNDDIRILVVSNKISELTDEQVSMCSEIIANMSIEYGMEIKGNILSCDELNSDTNNLLYLMTVNSINMRNLKNPLFIIKECVIDNEIHTNEYVYIIRNTYKKTTPREISDRYNIPISIITNLNPHLSDSIYDGDLVFLPLTIAIKGITSVVLNSRKSAFIRCKKAVDITEGVI